MPYSPANKAVFVWIPKTAGSSIADVLRRYAKFRRWGKRRLWGRIPESQREHYGAANWQHIRVTDVRSILGNRKYDRMFSFTFVRNPFDRLVSFYEYSKAARHDTGSVQFGLPPVGDFRDWFASHQHRTQMSYLRADCVMHRQSHLVDVDFVARFENLQHDFERICERLSIPAVPLPSLRTSNRGQYRQYFSDDLRSEAESIYSDDLQQFDYEF